VWGNKDQIKEGPEQICLEGNIIDYGGQE